MAKDKLKVCNLCLVRLPITDFYIDKKRVNGVRSRCKECDFRARNNMQSKVQQHVGVRPYTKSEEAMLAKYLKKNKVTKVEKTPNNH